MTIEELSPNSFTTLTEMFLKLWPECVYEEEFENCQRIYKSPTETFFLSKENNIYTGFIQMALRSDPVEGTSSSPVAYIEGIYIEPEYRQNGIARKLVERGEHWGIEHGCKEIASDTEVHNQISIAFHLQSGFEEINRVVCFRKTLERNKL